MYNEVCPATATATKTSKFSNLSVLYMIRTYVLLSGVVFVS